MGWRSFLGFPEKKTEQRTISWPFDVGPPRYALGVSDENTALSLHAVFAATRLLADSVACLPLHVYRDVGGRREKVTASTFFDRPSAYGTQFDWIYQAMTSLLLHGNAYGLVAGRDGYGYPTTIEWLNPDKVSCEQGDTIYSTVWRYNGREVPRDDLFHVRAYTLPGRILGVSPIKHFAPVIASGLAANDYGNTWYSNGGFPPGTFKNNQQMVDHERAEEVKARLMRAIASKQPLVYGMDWDYSSITVPPDEAQFLASMKVTASQIAAIYDVPAERVAGEPGGSLTYATQEQDQIRLALTTQKWCTRLEHAFFGVLPQRQYVRFNLDAMIRTDLKTRHEVYKMDREMGLKNLDELRDLEDLPPLPNSEGQDYTPLQAQIAVTTAEAQPRRALTEEISEDQPSRPRLVS